MMYFPKKDAEWFLLCTKKARGIKRFLLLARGSSPKFISLNNNNNTLIMDDQMNNEQKAQI
jgi:hypothetical protein